MNLPEYLYRSMQRPEKLRMSIGFKQILQRFLLAIIIGV